MQKFDVKKEVYRNRLTHLLSVLFMLYILLYYIFEVDGVLYGVLYTLTGEYQNQTELYSIQTWILSVLLVVTYYIVVFIYRTLKGLATPKVEKDSLTFKDGVFYINPPFTLKEIKIRKEHVKSISYFVSDDSLYLYFVYVDPKRILKTPKHHEIVINKRYIKSVFNLFIDLRIPFKPCRVGYLKEMYFTIMNLMKE